MAVPGLIICILLVAYLLVLDSRRRTSLSWAVWIPIVFLLVVGSRPLSMWFGGNRSWDGSGLANDVAGSPIDQIFFFAMIAGSFIVGSLRKVRWKKFLMSNYPLLLFYLYFAISISWSEDPMGSSKRLFKDFGMLVVMALIFSEKDPLEAIRTVYVRCACVLFPFSAVCIKWFPSIARTFSMGGEPAYTGVTTQKNTLGEIVLVFGSFIVWDCLESLPRKWRWNQLPWDRIFLLLIGFWLLRVSESKTAMVCLALSITLLVASGWFASKTISRAVLVGALCLPYLLFFAQKFNAIIEPIVEALGRNMTFTGRTDIWQHINGTTVNPLIGFGYYNFWGGSGGTKVNEIMHMTIPNAHDGYLDIYLDGGVIGLALLFYVLIAYGWRLTKGDIHVRFQRLRFAMLIAAIVYNLSESNWARISAIWFTTVLVLVYTPSIRAVRRSSSFARSRAAESPDHIQAEQPHGVYGFKSA